MATRKEQLREEASNLGIDVKQSWTIKELEAVIAEQQGGAEAELEFEPLTEEQIAKQREAEREREARPGAITTGGISGDPVLTDGDTDDDEVEEQVFVGERTDDSAHNDTVEEPTPPAPTEDADVDRNNIKNLPEPTHDEQVEDDKVVVRYTREVGSYQIGRHKFTPNSPFSVVDREFAEKHFYDGHPDVRLATPDEVKEFYGS